MPAFKQLEPGDPAPWFRQRSASNPRFAFDTIAGRYIVFCFFGSAADPRARAALQAALARPDIFNDEHASFFGVSNDAADEKERRVAERYPGYRCFWDFDGQAARLYGALASDDTRALRQLWIVLDPGLRVLAVLPFADASAERVIALVADLPAPSRHAGAAVYPPVLALPRVFEPELCRILIAAYESGGGQESGFMREVDGKTVLVFDHAHKRRRDFVVEDQALIKTLQERVKRRLAPEIAKAFQYKVTRMERYLVGCYAAEDQGHFRPHRDNTTKGTAHRRFAVTINLNDDFEGGELSFPEFPPHAFKPPPGGAVVFSCGLLHAASPVTAGKRYAFLPFLYDEAAAEERETNNAFLGEGVGEYKKGG